jgi:hypothetical protein
MIITTIEQILSNSWNETKNEVFPMRTPAKWLESKTLELDDIKLWEEIFYQPGLIGVYASWDPYEEFYIIVHNLHLHHNFFETFVGASASNLVVERCKLFGIELSYNEI